MMPSVVKNTWNRTLAGFRDLVLILFSNVILELFYKKGVLKNLALFTGKRLCHSLFLNCNFIKKETLTQGFSCGLCKIFKSILFTEHIWTHTSILQMLLTYTLQLYIAVNFQIVKSHSPEKKLIHISQGFYIFRIFFFSFFSFSFFLTNTCLPCRLRKANAVL